jgi:hypothetical protein
MKFFVLEVLFERASLIVMTSLEIYVLSRSKLDTNVHRSQCHAHVWYECWYRVVSRSLCYNLRSESRVQDSIEAWSCLEVPDL